MGQYEVQILDSYDNETYFDGGSRAQQMEELILNRARAGMGILSGLQQGATKEEVAATGDTLDDVMSDLLVAFGYDPNFKKAENGKPTPLETALREILYQEGERSVSGKIAEAALSGKPFEINYTYTE